MPESEATTGRHASKVSGSERSPISEPVTRAAVNTADADAGKEFGIRADWRAAVKLRQLAAVPEGPAVVACSAPYGVGGLGRILSELVEALRSSGNLAAYLSPSPKPEDLPDPGIAARVPPQVVSTLMRSPVRLSPGWSVLLENLAFDFASAPNLPRFGDHLIVFNGHARRHISTARRLRYASVSLVSANSHMEHEARRHRDAWRSYPIERPWGMRSVRTNVAEYKRVDQVYVHSRYAWESFVNEGFPAERLRLFPLMPHERFRPRTSPPSTETFNIVYIGSLSVHKGVPLLIDAVRRLRYHDLRLVLVGGWGTRGMRRHIETACAQDGRISLRPGDPLPHLLEAGVCVHPSYVDGYAYAAAEAVACSVPLIVSADTGMSELVSGYVLGRIVPTGDLDALTEALDDAYRGVWPNTQVGTDRDAGKVRDPWAP